MTCRHSRRTSGGSTTFGHTPKILKICTTSESCAVAWADENCVCWRAESQACMPSRKNLPSRTIFLVSQARPILWILSAAWLKLYVNGSCRLALSSHFPRTCSCSCSTSGVILIVGMLFLSRRAMYSSAALRSAASSLKTLGVLTLVPPRLVVGFVCASSPWPCPTPRPVTEPFCETFDAVHGRGCRLSGRLPLL